MIYILRCVPLLRIYSRTHRYKRHDLLAFGNNKYDRDYVEFNVKINDLEGGLQQFINASFENITSIDHSLALLHRSVDIKL